MASYVIEKLNATNYANWSSDMKYLLMEKGNWDIINEEKSIPVKSASVSDDDIFKFKTRFNQTLSMIYLNVDPEYRKIIENCDNPVIAWKELKLNNYPDSRAHHMKMFSELLDCKIQPNESINIFAARLLRLSNQLKEINEKFDEIYTCFQLLRFLPKHFDGIVQHILRWDGDKFKFNLILNELIAEQTRLEIRDYDNPRSSIQQSVTLNRRRHRNRSRGRGNNFREPSSSFERNDFLFSRRPDRKFSPSPRRDIAYIFFMQM